MTHRDQKGKKGVNKNSDTVTRQSQLNLNNEFSGEYGGSGDALNGNNNQYDFQSFFEISDEDRKTRRENNVDDPLHITDIQHGTYTSSSSKDEDKNKLKITNNIARKEIDTWLVKFKEEVSSIYMLLLNTKKINTKLSNLLNTDTRTRFMDQLRHVMYLSETFIKEAYGKVSKRGDLINTNGDNGETGAAAEDDDQNNYQSPTGTNDESKPQQTTLEMTTEDSILLKALEDELIVLDRLSTTGPQIFEEERVYNKIKSYRILQLMKTINHKNDEKLLTILLSKISSPILESEIKKGCKKLSANKDLDNKYELFIGASTIINKILLGTSEITIGRLMQSERDLHNYQINYKSFSKNNGFNKVLDEVEDLHSRHLETLEELSKYPKYEGLGVDTVPHIFWIIMKKLLDQSNNSLDSFVFKAIKDKLYSALTEAEDGYMNERGEHYSLDTREAFLKQALLRIDSESETIYGDNRQQKEKIILNINQSNRGKNDFVTWKSICPKTIRSGSCNDKNCKFKFGVTREAWENRGLCNNERNGSSCGFGDRCVYRHQSDNYSGSRSQHTSVNPRSNNRVQSDGNKEDKKEAKAVNQVSFDKEPSVETQLYSCSKGKNGEILMSAVATTTEVNPDTERDSE